MKDTEIQRVEYYYANVRDQPGQAYQMLSQLANLGVNLLAFAAVPIGPNSTQLTLFPEDPESLTSIGDTVNLQLLGPHHALLVMGRDEMGALAGIHKKLYDAGINIYASNGVSDGKGQYGYIIYVRPEEYEEAAQALGI